MDNSDYDEDMRQEIAEEILEAVENLALMTQREFVAVREEIRGEMQVMSDELRSEFLREMQIQRDEIRMGWEAFYGKLHEEIEDLRQEMKAGFAPISGMVANHEYRIERAEKKLDIS